MRSFFYARLALSNLKRNRQTQLPFLLTCIGAVLMFYSVCALTYHSAINGSVRIMMQIGMWVTAIFSVIFLFYTNSFLIKRRKKEFGLFCVLGMEKRHIGRILFWETVFTAIAAIAIGLLLGIAFSKLTTMLLYKLLGFDPNLAFEISPHAIGLSACLFAVAFLLMLLLNLCQVYVAQPTELLRGGNVGEKEPKTRWLLTLVGIVTLGAGYGLALTIQDPLAVVGTFFLDVLLVMIGTYCLFTAGSIALLKLLRKNKGYYYKAKHFISISGMIYRMKQNAVGLANICLMSTAVLVMLSTTVSMYVGLEDLLQTRYPHDVTIQSRYFPEDEPDLPALSEKVNTILSQDGVQTQTNTAFRYLSFTALRNGNAYSVAEDEGTAGIEDLSVVTLMPADDYTALTGAPVSLGSGEVLLYSNSPMENIEVFGRSFSVQQQLTTPPEIGSQIAGMVDEVYVILPDVTTFHELCSLQKQTSNTQVSYAIYQIALDFAMPEAEKTAFVQNQLLPQLQDESLDVYRLYTESRQVGRASFYELYGSLFFLGIFLGLLFLMATVLIIYYKQVIEGFEDKERFAILQKVGMSHAEVKKTIRSQILTVFALPILAAGVHIAVAFPILTKLLALLNLTNIPLFITVTWIVLLVFVFIYALVYALTARVYYRIVYR